MKISSRIQRTITRTGLLWLVVFLAAIFAVVLPRAATSTLTRSAKSVPSAVVIRQITLATKDLVYDPGTQRIYASVPSSAGAIGNSITQIDPVLGTIGASVFMGSEPGKLAISDNSQYIYAVLDGAAAVRRFDLATQTAGLQFLVGTGSSGTFFAEDIAVLPAQPDSVAISRKYQGTTPKHAGVGVYDNGTLRPNTTPTGTGSNVIEFSGNSATLYGYNNESTEFGFRKMTIDASGVSIVATSPNVFFGFGLDILHHNGLVYANRGRAINPETPTPVGTYVLGDTPSSLVLADSSVNRVYFLTGIGSFTVLKAFDLTTFVQTGSLSLTGVSGTPGGLIKWGADGLAFRTSGNQVFVLSTSDIVPIGPTPLPPPTQVASGVIRVAAMANDLAYDPNTQKVYASLPSSVGSFGNSIAPINPLTGTMSTPVFVGSEPGKVVISATPQYVYAALDGTGAVRRFDLGSQTAGLQFALGRASSGPYYVEDMAVLPDDPNAIAVSRRNLVFSSHHEGVGIYDSGVVRPTVTTQFAGISDVIEFSSGSATLYGINNETSEFGFRKMAVNASGVTITSATLGLIDAFGTDIKYDNGRVYTSNGKVIDPAAATLTGTFAGVNTLAFVTDSSVNRAFYVTGSGASATLQAFDLNTFLPAGSSNIPGVSGTPKSLIRWGLNGLAFRTTAGEIVFVRSPLVPSSLNLTVNDAGDAADNNVGDNVCDTSAAGGSQCTLRAAIQETNADAATQNSIVFDPSLNGSAITLASALPGINSSVTVTGPGASLLTIRRSSAAGTPNFRIFTINSGTTVSISGFTITNGRTADAVPGPGNVSGDPGGGISSSGTLTLSNTIVSGNSTGIGSTNGGGGTNGVGGEGGGIYNVGTLNLNNSTVSGNTTGMGGPQAQGGSGGGIHNRGTLTLNDSTVSGNQTGNGGNGSAGGGYGGGIFNESLSMLTLNNTTVSNNQTGTGGIKAGTGGGISCAGTVTLNNSTVTGNHTGDGNGYGAGISTTATLILTNSTISNNITGALADGAGIRVDGGTVTATNSIISGNQTSPGGEGGGIDSVHPITLLNCLITNNASGTAGGLYIDSSSPSTVTNSTISGNTSTGAGGGLRYGGSLTLTNVTITNNRSDSDNSGGEQGGGIDRFVGTLTLKNTLVAGNFRGSSPSTTADDIAGTLNAASSFNLIGTGGSGGLSNGVNNNQVGVVDPRLGPLANNGGPTLTHALLFGSPAIDAANTSLTSDQRGHSRPFDDANVMNAAGSNATDIGAYEAHNYQVNSIADIGDGACTALSTGNGCTLREAIDASNSDVGSDVITFAPALTSAGPATITLQNALADLTSDMSIAGPGSNLLTIQRSAVGGTPTFRIFTINSGKTVTISGLTISNGNATSGIFPANTGGAILNAGSLALNSVIVSGNTANAGGGISSSGPLTLKNTLVSGNTAASAGGGISIQAGVPVAIEDSTISGNNALNGSGGGIFNNLLASTLTLTLRNSTLSGNHATGGNGGGIYNNCSQGAMVLGTFTNVTISGNTSGFGGGIANNSQGPGTTIKLTITNGTITSNNVIGANSIGGGIANNQFGTTNTLILHNTIVAGNFRDSAAALSDIASPVDPASSFNLISDGTGASGISNGSNGNQIGTSLVPISPRLGPLANNGGPTQTHAFVAASTALDAGNNALVVNPPFIGPPFNDQRGAGFARIVDGPDPDTTDRVDIGAFEAQVSVADIPDQTINEDGSLSLPFNVGGSASITTLTAMSSDINLVPNNATNISISGSGSTRTLVINPLANASGSATITVTVNGNNSQSMSDEFILTVNPVNDAPSFTVGSDQTVNENDGAQTVNGWATNISAGPNESGQTVNFVVLAISNPSLLAGAPTVSPAGALSYVPATGASGTTQITLALRDNGGTANGGVDASATQTFNINVLEGGALQFSSATFTSAEDGVSAIITITRAGGAAGEARVDYATSNGTATAGSDYAAASGTLVFANGVTTQTFSVQITNDAVDEPDETVNLTLTNAAGSGSLGAPSSATLTITDEDAAPGVSINDVSTTERDSGTVNVGFTVSLSGQSSQTVTVNFATANGTATAVSDYQSNSGTVTFLPLETAKSISVTINGDVNFEADETFFVNLSSPVNANVSDNQGQGTILNDDAQGGVISFSQSNYTIGESDGLTTITVNRTNDLSAPATVDYATADDSGSATVVPCSTANNIASSRCDYTTALGTLRFAAGESAKTFTVLISQDNYVEGSEALALTLSNPTGAAVLATPSTATLTITDDLTEPATNPIDAADVFVRQHYHDFLNREPDAAGLAFWTNQITECQQPGATCDAQVRRVNVSAAFFLSIEFQETGFLVYRVYKAGYGNIAGTPVPVRFLEFLPDTQQIGNGVVVGVGNWQAQLEANKVAFAQDFVARSRFTTAYPTTLTPAQFVDALFANAGVTPTATDRDAAIGEFGGAGNTSDTAARARAVRRVAENSTLKQQETNNAFVLMQYFGYLRRNPNDAPEQGLNFDGYNFWLGKLNQFNGNFVAAEMVKAFLVSGEYRQRFGP